MPDVPAKDVIAAALYEHSWASPEFPEAEPPRDETECCATAVLDALKAAGYVVVQLPKPDAMYADYFGDAEHTAEFALKLYASAVAAAVSGANKMSDVVARAKAALEAHECADCDESPCAWTRYDQGEKRLRIVPELVAEIERLRERPGALQIPVGGGIILHLDEHTCHHTAGDVCPSCARLTGAEVAALREYFALLKSRASVGTTEPRQEGQ